jgi:RNA recognition motif-containing protein
MFEIYVGNLPYGTSEAELLDAFETYGEVESIKIVTDRTRNYAFVVMPNEDEAAQATEALDQTDLAGQRINVRRSKDKGHKHSRVQRNRNRFDD